MRKQRDQARPNPKAIHRKACPFCGGNTYQLILEHATTSEDSSLLVHCYRCSRPKNVEGEFKSILWV